MTLFPSAPGNSPAEPSGEPPAEPPAAPAIRRYRPGDHGWGIHLGRSTAVRP